MTPRRGGTGWQHRSPLSAKAARAPGVLSAKKIGLLPFLLSIFLPFFFFKFSQEEPESCVLV